MRLGIRKNSAFIICSHLLIRMGKRGRGRVSGLPCSAKACTKEEIDGEKGKGRVGGLAQQKAGPASRSRNGWNRLLRKNKYLRGGGETANKKKNHENDESRP